MKTYTYIVEAAVESTKVCPIMYDGQAVATVQRIYSNKLKKWFDQYFDFRYFVKYETKVNNEVTFSVKKIHRRGKVWFEALNVQTNEPYAILYENWRIAIPEMTIKGANFEMKIFKEMEGWTTFTENEVEVARWQAVFDEATQLFHITIEIEAQCSIQQPDFFACLGQALLFIGV